MNIKVIAVLATLCIFQASAFLDFGKKSKDLTILSTCTKEKKCSHFCLAKKLNISSESGEITTAKIPFYENLKPLGIEKCITEGNKISDNCEKFSSIQKCLQKSGLSSLKTNIETCAKELNTTELKLDTASAMKMVMNPNSIKCYIKCVFEKFDLVNADGTPKLDEFEKEMTQKGYQVGTFVEKMKKCQEKGKAEKGKAEKDNCGKIIGVVACAASNLNLSNLKQFKSLVGS